MVVRPPIEKWSRVQLEENFHSAYQQLLTAQKKVNEQEKKITVLNTRLRSSVMERKAKEDEFVEREKFEELQRKNQLLALKLKTAKHQIMTYTTPAARPITASAMTGRTTHRPQPSNRRPLQSATTPADKTARTEPNTERTRTPTVQINETTLKDKAAFIRLNRLVREKNGELAELQYEVERLNGVVVDLRSQLEKKSSTIQELELEARNARERGGDAQYLGRIELISKELAVIQAENEVLKGANERLVKQSLSVEFDESAKEQIELRKQIAILEERIKDVDQRRLRAEQRLKSERRKMRKNATTAAEKLPEKEIVKSEESAEESEMPTVKKDREKRRKKKDKGDDDILERLYRDVSAILETHDDRLGSADMETTSESLSKWKKMYASLYDELEKVRNMLLIQNNINQKQTSEISLLQEELEAVKVRYEMKLKEMRDKVVEKQKRVLLLEEQIRSIAYANQKPIPVKATGTKQEQLSTDLSIMFTSISLSEEYVAAVGVCPAYFMSLEFFDFELQTTPMFTKQSTTLDFTTIYSVVVSNLFVHYIETNGITIEMYTPHNANPTLLAAGVVNLKPLLQKGARSRFVGELKLIGFDSGTVLATLKYELNTTEQLGKAVANFRAAEAAQKVLPLEIPFDNEAFDELTVMVHRCTGLDKLKRGEIEVCVIYEFFSFSPYFTNYVVSSKVAEFNSKRDWSVPHEALHSYLTETEITFFLFEDRPETDAGKDGVIAMLSLPLTPLKENKPIRGSFEMVKADGSDSGLYLDVTVMWKHAISQVMPKTVPAETVVKEPKAMEKAEEPKAPLIDNRDNRSGSSSRSDDDYSPLSVSSPKIPSVSESIERERATIEREDIETVSLKRSSARSSPESQDEVVHEEEVVFPSSSSSSQDSGDHSSDIPPIPSIETDQGPQTRSEQASAEAATDEKETEKIEEKEKDKEEIRGLLGNLPPIAKPRLSKPPSEYSKFPLFSDHSKQGSSGSVSSKDSKEEETADGRHRTVVFTDPLHRSIPPSETSSSSSPPPKPAVPLPPAGVRSAIKATKKREEKEEVEDSSDTDETRTVSIFIDRIYIPEFSRLLHPSYDNVNVYVDWFFLDYPLEESRTPKAIPLPRVPDSPGLFVYKKEFHLSRRRVALLEQWLELGNRLDFTLITEGEDSEELAVAQLELGRTTTDETTTIQFLDINGEHYADLDLVISYSTQIFDCLRG